VTIANIYSGKGQVIGQASVLNESEIRRVFRFIETSRHAGRNRLCLVLSVYIGLRVGEIAALTIGDVAAQTGDVRREIELEAHQTKGSKGRTVILSERVREEIASFFKNKQPYRDQGSPLIASQRNERSAMSRCRCYSGKSRRQQAFGPPHIRAGGLSRHA
jgi:integrase/recombinase XerD